MENLNAEAVKKALEYWVEKYQSKYYTNHAKDALALINSQEQRIKELEQCWEHEHASAMEIFGQWSEKCERLTEENERLQLTVGAYQVKDALLSSQLDDKCDRCIARDRADTVREMQERLEAHLEKPEFPWDSFTVAEEVIDQIAKEMLEGEK